MHTHCIAFNATHDPEEQRWKALQNHEMLRARKYVEAVYYHELAKDLHRLGYRIRNRARGDFEIEGVSDAVCDRFSKRHEQIDNAQAVLLRAKPELAEANQKDLREHLATAERARKMRDVGRAELNRLWSAQLSAEEADSLRRLRATPAQVDAKSEFESVAAAADWAEEHIFDRRSVVPEHEVWRQALIRARGERLSVGGVKAETRHRQYVRDESQVANITTREVLAREWEIVRAGSEGVSSFGPLVHSLPAMPATFAEEQRKALTHLLKSRDFITLFHGGAGTGKSFVLKALVASLNEVAHSVVTLAPQRQQVVDLAANGFHSPTTLADFLTRKRMKQGAVVVLDEAGQVGGKQMHELVSLVQEHGGRLILSGDTRQHGPVEASDAMLALERYAGLKPAELRRIRRQNPNLGKDREDKHSIRRYRRAVTDAAAGRLKESFAGLEKLGAVVSCPFGSQTERLAEEYLRHAEAGHSQVVVAQTWNEVNAVNEYVRAGLREKGLLGKTETEVVALERVDLTNPQKRGGRYLPPDAVLVFNQPIGPVPRGTCGTFVGAVKRGVLVEVGDKWRLVPQKELGRITVCKPRKLSLAHGDKLQLKANRRLKSGGAATNGEIVAVECVHEDGRIALRDGRTLDPDYREFVHGYAVTSYGSQGKTVDYVLFSDSAVRAATNSRQWYVTISRGRRGIRIFTPDKAALRENVLRSGDSPLALDLVGGTAPHHARLGVLSWSTKGVVSRVCFISAHLVRFQLRDATTPAMCRPMFRELTALQGASWSAVRCSSTEHAGEIRPMAFRWQIPSRFPVLDGAQTPRDACDWSGLFSLKFKEASAENAIDINRFQFFPDMKNKAGILTFILTLASWKTENCANALILLGGIRIGAGEGNRILIHRSSNLPIYLRNSAIQKLCLAATPRQSERKRI